MNGIGFVERKELLTPEQAKARLQQFRNPEGMNEYFKAQLEAEERGPNRPEVIAALRREMQRRCG